MLQTVKQKRDEGFTIIEVLIVLAIAGLIMVVVFLAVPALQRNSRNNQTKTEANNTLSAYSELVGNNGGVAGSVSTSATNGSDAFKVKDNAGGQNLELVSIIAGPASGTTEIPKTNTKTTNVIIYTKAKCTSGQASTTVSPASNREAALVYWVETTGNPQSQCVNG